MTAFSGVRVFSVSIIKEESKTYRAGFPRKSAGSSTTRIVEAMPLYVYVWMYMDRQVMILSRTCIHFLSKPKEYTHKHSFKSLTNESPCIYYILIHYSHCIVTGLILDSIIKVWLCHVHIVIPEHPKLIAIS